ncbi:MAG: hypothetical protein Q4F10_05680 [Corynebacterium glutamicum]|nr:hypothetical protein [Corynebacterium glutamicum]
MQKLLRDGEFLMEQVVGLGAELHALGCENPTLMAMGNVVF